VKSLARALGYLKRYWHTALGALVSLFLVSGANLLVPRLLQRVIDEGIGGKNMPLIWMMMAAMIGVALVRAIFAFLQGFLSEKTSQGIAFDLRNELYAKIQSLSFSYHDQAQTGQLMTRATSDVEGVRMFAGMALIQVISSLVMMIGSLTVLFSMSWKLAFVPLAAVPLTFAIIGGLASRLGPMFMLIQQKLAALNTVLQENLAGVRVVKAFVREPYEAQRYVEKNKDLYEQSIRAGRLMSFIFPSVFFVSNLATVAIYWYGGFLAMEQQLTVGEIVAFASYLMMLMFPVMNLGMIAAILSRASASAQRVFEIIDAVSEVTDAPDAIPLPAIEGRVTFDNVIFRYFGSGEKVLDDVSFVAEPGQTVALLGATGSGKSTIINLIPRFYDVSEGQIAIDGHDVRKVKIDSLRSQIGIVLQETTLFTGTIHENIAYGRPGASMEEIIEAAKAAAAHDFIMSFPNGYDTPVGERGATLSGGQKQRVAIARALLTNPRILILDDSTSNVDLETEYQIQQALDKLMKGRTSLVIAQRISTVLNADQILVLDRGRIVARGTHEELLENNPIYAEIYYSQLRPVEELEKGGLEELRMSAPMMQPTGGFGQ
jgi:ATP-binding cassette subfamily B protein